MSHLNFCNKNQKIINFTTKITRKSDAKNTLKRPISPSSIIVDKRESQTDDSINSPAMANDNTSASNLSFITEAENNSALKNALSPLITEFRLLRESVETVHHDYTDLKQTISKQKEELKHELVDKIDKNTSQLIEISHENKILHKENEQLKTRLDRKEQNQLSNNIIITGIPEGPYEQYSTTKLRVQEMIAVTIDSGDADADLAKAKGTEITNCSRMGKFKHNSARPISVTFSI